MKTTKNKIVYEDDICGKEGKAIALVFPSSIEEIKNLIRLSDSDIVVRGGGTSFSSAVSPQNSIIVDMSKMNKVIDLNLNKKTIVVEPGIIIKELNEYLEEYGLEFPIIPLFSGIETIGGLIAKNSSGSREVKYGRMINWIESLEIINGKGEQKRISKSDLSDFVGMEGTTGIMIQATLRLTNKKLHSLTILKSEGLDFVLEANRKLRLEQDVSSIDIISKQVSHLLGFEKKYHIFVEYESEKGLFKKNEYEKFTKTKNSAYAKASNELFYLMESIKVYADSLEDFLIYLEEQSIPYIGHLSSGVIYPLFHPSQKEKQIETLKFAKKLRASISYNSGFGLKNKEFVQISDKELIKRIKIRNDPLNKLNSGKLIDKPIETKIQIMREENKEEQTRGKEEISEINHELPEITEITDEPIQEDQAEMPDPEKITLKKPERELTQEERDKVKKIAFGFFGTKKGDEKDKEGNGGYLG